MALSATIDVAVGLAFTYLLLGILASAAQELFTTWTKKRGKDLRDGIARLLAGIKDDGTPHKALFEKVVGHALIENLSAIKLPSYVPARNFALALTEALKDGSHSPLFTQIENSVAGLPAGSAKEALTALVTRAAGDVDALQHGIERWFDDAMDRLSGAYKRYSQYFTLIFGLAIAVALNVDSITLARTLWGDQSLRTAVAAAAERYAAQQQGAKEADLKANIDAAKRQLEDLNLPIGWSRERAPWTVLGDILSGRDPTKLWVVLGWIITGFAVSLGAPFWFDSLEDLVRLRNAGPKPQRPARALTSTGTGR
jgi:hypothetical protein